MPKKDSRRKKRVVISGFYGFNNIGDESVLKAVIMTLRDGVKDTEITVLSNDPESTAEKFGVHAVHRMRPLEILRALSWCDLLISGGGSLLQDATSTKSLLYYLSIIKAAEMMGKKVMIYSQGIGPINSPRNRRMTIKTLMPLKYIIVRDEASAELLIDNGIPESHVFVTADPVLRLRPPSLDAGRRILREAGVDPDDGRIKIAFALKGTTDEDFKSEIIHAARMLHEKYDARIVLLPFHYTEDRMTAREIAGNLDGTTVCMDRKFSTDEMMSLIGCMDYLVGVRLHSLIHAATMGVPMIGISYDPKVNRFMKGLRLKALCTVYDFEARYLLEEFERVRNNRDAYIEKIQIGRDKLRETLSLNEVLINRLLEE